MFQSCANFALKHLSWQDVVNVIILFIFKVDQLWTFDEILTSDKS